MQQIRVDDCVRLRQDVPEVGLRRGAIGVVCSMWFSPTTAYEVEVQSPELGHKPRVVLLENQIQPWSYTGA